MTDRPERILIIKHGALGDIVLATGPFRAIRDHHASAHITLLTTKPYAKLMETCGWFDEIWIDDKPKIWQMISWLGLRKMLRAAKFDRVYDLQHTDRSHLYFRMFGNPKPEWSGIVKGASHPHDNPNRDKIHTIERQAEQLAAAGIASTPPTDLSWLKSDPARFHLADRYALLVPGGAPHRPRKRWPPSRYAALAIWLQNRDVQPVLIGTLAESDALDEIKERVPTAENLCEDTTFADIAGLARGAVVAIGNDTGPMHLISGSGCPTLVLFSDESVPVQTSPRGETVKIIESPSLENLGVARVITELAEFVPAFRGNQDDKT